MRVIEKNDEKNLNTGGEESRVCIFRTCRDSVEGKDAPNEDLRCKDVIYSMARSELRCV
jgi:hypothetical protein